MLFSSNPANYSSFFASFRVLGKSPFLKHVLIMRVRGGERLVAQAFTNLGDTLSKPDEVFDERVFINFQVWWLSISFSLKVFSLFSFWGRNSL